MADTLIHAPCDNCGHPWAAHHRRQLYPTLEWFEAPCYGGECHVLCEMFIPEPEESWT